MAFALHEAQVTYFIVIIESVIIIVFVDVLLMLKMFCVFSVSSFQFLEAVFLSVQIL